MAAELHPVLLAGERQSIKIEGFDFGNSPLEFSKERVHAKTIVMSTSNGTRAIKVTEGSYRSFVGTFRNAAALCQLVKSIGKDVWIVCAGTEGYFSLEDALCAGLLAERLVGVSPVDTSDKVQAAILMYQAACDSLADVTGLSRNGKRLHKLGMSADVEFCLQLDQLDLIPEYRGGKIKALRPQEPFSS